MRQVSVLYLSEDVKTTSEAEVTSEAVLASKTDLKFEHCGFNNPCSSAFLASKCFFEPFVRKKEGQNGHVDLRARTSPQVKIPNRKGFRACGICTWIKDDFLKNTDVFSHVGHHGQ